MATTGNKRGTTREIPLLLCPGLPTVCPQCRLVELPLPLPLHPITFYKSFYYYSSWFHIARLLSLAMNGVVNQPMEPTKQPAKPTSEPKPLKGSRFVPISCWLRSDAILPDQRLAFKRDTQWHGDALETSDSCHSAWVITCHITIRWFWLGHN